MSWNKYDKFAARQLFNPGHQAKPLTPERDGPCQCAVHIAIHGGHCCLSETPNDADELTCGHRDEFKAEMKRADAIRDGGAA